MYNGPRFVLVIVGGAIREASKMVPRQKQLIILIKCKGLCVLIKKFRKFAK